MFGSDLDFFGVYAKRRRMSLDLDKRKKIADTRAHLRMMGRDEDLNKIFLSKSVLFSKIMGKRKRLYVEARDSGFRLLEGIDDETMDPVAAAAVNMVTCDRLDDLQRVWPSLTRGQRAQVDQALDDYRARLNDTGEDATPEPAPDAGDASEEAPNDGDDTTPTKEPVE